MIFRFRKILFITGFLIVCSLSHKATAQNYVQYSGVVVTADSMKPISFATVYDITNGNGIYANYQGFFSLVVSPGDSVMFTSIGFMRQYVLIPIQVNTDKFSAEIKLQQISYKLPQTIVYPYPSRDEFRNEFLHLNIPDDNLARAKRNLSPEAMAQAMRNAPADPTVNHMKLMQQYSKSLYYIGQYQPISLLDPFAWAQFFEAIKNGELKSSNNTTQPTDESGESNPSNQ
jgi:hypothetical protein